MVCVMFAAAGLFSPEEALASFLDVLACSRADPSSCRLAAESLLRRSWRSSMPRRPSWPPCIAAVTASAEQAQAFSLLGPQQARNLQQLQRPSSHRRGALRSALPRWSGVSIDTDAGGK